MNASFTNTWILRCARFALSTLLCACCAGSLSAQTIYASGQLFIPADPTHNDIRENRIYAIDVHTGQATPTSPVLSGTPPALAETSDGRLLGFNSGQLGQVNVATGGFTPIGSPAGISGTGLDILADGRAYTATLGANARLYQLNTTTGAASAVGNPGVLGRSLDAAFGLAPGTSQPFIIGLGSVGNTLYGVDLETGRTNLVAIDVTAGTATPIGAVNALGVLGGGRYSGFSAMTGVDENSDGTFDALYGNVNFDSLSPNPQNRIGALARYDLTTGTFAIIGQNPGLIYFGFGSSPAAVPEPGSIALFVGLSIAGFEFARTHRAGRRRSRVYSQRPTEARLFARHCLHPVLSRRVKGGRQ